MDENLSPMEFMEKHTDGVYEFRYQMLKDAVFDLYLWGLRTDNMDAINFYGEMLKLFRKYDANFMRATNDDDKYVN